MDKELVIKTEKESMDGWIRNNGLEHYMDVQTIEDQNTKLAIIELDIKKENDTIADEKLEPALKRIKYENNVTKSLHESGLPTFIDEIAVKVKIEPNYSNVEKSESILDILIQEQIDIKDVRDTDLETSAKAVLNSNHGQKRTRKQDEMERIYLEACAQYEKSNTYKYKRPNRLCTQCNVRFNSKLMLDEHTLRKHPDLIGSVSWRIHACTICSYKTTLAPHLARHRMNEHLEAELGLDHQPTKPPDLTPTDSCIKLHECSACPYISTTAAGLARHKCKHPERRELTECQFNTCARCNVKFKTKKTLDKHIVKNHPDLIGSVTCEVYECARCDFKTTTWRGASMHMCKAKTNLEVPSDRNVTKNRPEGTESLSSEVEENGKYYFELTTSIGVSMHMCKAKTNLEIPCDNPATKKHHNRAKSVSSKVEERGPPLVCCGKTFRRKIFLDDHITKNHPNRAKLVSSEVFRCAKCTYKTTMKRCLGRHMCKHSGKADTLKRKASFRPIQTCEACNITFKRKASLDDHIVKKHPDLIGSVTTTIHACPFCFYKTTGRRNRDRHVKLQHPEISVNYRPSVCVCCYAKFRNKLRLDDHILKRHPHLIDSISSEVYACTDCSYKTTTRGYLYRHTMTQHYNSDSIKPVTCIECGSAFKSKTSLDDHVIKKHPDLIAIVTSKIHKCPVCGYTTTQSSDYVRHMFRHPEAHGKYGFKYVKCQTCDGTFKSKMALEDHIFRMHPEIISGISSKIHECPVCPFKTAIKKNFQTHLSKHCQACVRCQKEFKTIYGLENHITRKHPDLGASATSKMYECTRCEYKSIFKRSFARHLLGHGKVSC